MWKNKKKLQSNNTTNKNFSYSKGDTTLKFSLRVDIKEELIDFLECLNEATNEVKKEINKI